jgi:uncharacterized protein YbjQ (UPF0145 family)
LPVIEGGILFLEKLFKLNVMINLNILGGVKMIITTTPTIEGKTIKTYFGIVAGEAIMGANIVRDIFASITDVIGGRSGAYEEKLVQAREIAINEMMADASRKGANAVVGVDLDYEVIREGMLMVTASGTAVFVEGLY